MGCGGRNNTMISKNRDNKKWCSKFLLYIVTACLDIVFKPTPCEFYHIFYFAVCQQSVTSSARISNVVMEYTEF